MRLSVRKDRCPICPPSTIGWNVTDQRGHCLYYSLNWRQAVDYACAATQPGTGDQVHQLVSKGVSQ